MRKTALSPVSDFGGLQFKFGANHDHLYFNLGEKICRSFFFSDQEFQVRLEFRCSLELEFSCSLELEFS